jgi:peptidoglycan L-alanyl-D-glutamate endopeptidase CwlK
LQDQAVLYAQGRTAPGRIVTNAKPGESAHNWGCAIDVVPLVNGKPVWDFHPDIDPWKTVGRLGQEAGFTWLGAPGSKFVEACHFELPDWKNYRTPT